MFFATLASVILYGMFTYAVRYEMLIPRTLTLYENFQMVFENTYQLSPLETAILVVCSVIIIVDIGSAILHIAWGSVAARRDIASQNKGKLVFQNAYKIYFNAILGLVTLDVISVISLLYPLFPSNVQPLYYVALGMECFRIYRVFRFFCKETFLRRKI